MRQRQSPHPFSPFAHAVIAWSMLALVSLGTPAVAQQQLRHNIVLFVADGLRAASVNERATPALAALAREGVWLRNSHSTFPTVTTANASVLATGHYVGDTGNFGNNLYSGLSADGAHGDLLPDLEYNLTLGEMDAHFGDYLNETTLLAMARSAGYSTAAIGKQGPTLIFDHTERTGLATLLIDDATGTAGAIPLAPGIAQRLQAAGLAQVTPGRDDKGHFGSHTANLLQQDYLVAATTRVVLPWLQEQQKPFVLVFWSRDPDATQHNQGDSPLKLIPGINGPTSLAAVRNADDNLARLRAALFELGLADSTDIIVTSDHGFSTISKQSVSSPAAAAHFSDVPAGMLPPGFLALDLAHALNLNVFDADADYALVGPAEHPKRGNVLLGKNRQHPRVIVAANSGNDLIYLQPATDRRLARRVVEFLLAQDYVSGLFVEEGLGRIDGALGLADLRLAGSAVTPRPSIILNFRSFDTGCRESTLCGAGVADTQRAQGQGGHGSLSRADTHNFMALVGPDFKSGYVDELPASNVDLGRTLMGLISPEFKDRGRLTGRQLTECFPGGALAQVRREHRASRATANGLQTVLDLQWVGETMYIDAGGFIGRTLGLGPSN